MKQILNLTLTAIAVGLLSPAYSQLSLNATSTAYTVDFSTTLSGVNNGAFSVNSSAQIFASSPSNGQLDADAWDISYDGASSGSTASFPGSQTADFTTLTSAGVSNTGYGAANISGNRKFAVCPSGSRATSGSLTLRIINNTGAPVTAIDISYLIEAYNDQSRGNEVEFYYSEDNSTYTNYAAATFVSTASSNNSIESSNPSFTLSGLNIANGGYFYIRWLYSDNTGSGSRDEFFLDDISVSAQGSSTPLLSVNPSSLTGFSTTPGNASASQSYDLSGANLTPVSGNITVTAPTDYEVSTDNSTFNNSLSVPYSGGNLGATTIYVRISSSASAGSPSGNVSNAGGGSVTQNVTLSGVVAVPSLIFTHADADVETMELLTLRKISLNSIGITDNGICSGGAFRDNEGSFTFPGSGLADIPAGTFVRVKWDGTGTNELDNTDGLVSVFPGSSIGGLNASGEQLIVYSGSPIGSTSCGNPNGSNTFLTAINWGTSGWINSSEPSASESYAPGTPTDFDPNTTDDAIEFNGNVIGNVQTLINSSGSGIRNFSNWTGTTSGSGNYNLKSILFQQSNFSSGTISFSSVNASGFTIDASSLSFSNSDTDTRYMVVMYTAAPSSPVDRYTCYSSVSPNYAAAADVVTSISGQTATDFCGSPIIGNGRVVYFDYSLPSVLAVTGLASNTNYEVRVFAVNGNGYTANFGTAGSGSQTTITGPSILTSVGNLTSFSTVSGTPSASQNYDLSASNLTPSSGNLVVTAPTDFEVSLDNSSFSSSVNVAYSGGTLTATTIYVRISASSGVGSPSGDVSNAGGGATTVNVAVDGTVTAPVVPPSIVVNKYDHSNDVVELLVVDNNLDMRSMVIKDFSSSNDNDNGGKSTFASTALWSSVPSGTLIILRPDNSAADVTHADGNYTIDVGALNTTYFSGSPSAMNPSSDDMIMIKTGTEAGTDNNIHTLSAGSAGTQFNAIAEGYVQRNGAGSSGYVYVSNTNSNLADYDLNAQVSTVSSGLTFGEPNTADNSTYICSLRGGGNAEPTANATGINFTSVTPSAITVNWTNPVSGGGARRIVIARATSTSGVVPSDGIDYNTSTVFTSPASPNGITGSGNVVVYDGTGTSVTVTNLASNTNYTFTIYEYNGVDFCTNYYTAGVSDSQTTLAGGNSTVNFETPISSTVSEGVGTVTLTLGITNPSPSAATTVQVNRTGGTGSAVDINGYGSQTVTFPANSTADQTVTITVTDDASFESTETLEFTLQNISGGQGTPAIGVNDQYTLTINDNDVPNIVINEIHYNPSTTQGNDTDYEFVELYNAESSTVDLSGYTFAQGITYTFPGGTTIDPGEYIIVTVNASSYSGNGYDVYQWATGALSNGGETVELQNSSGATVDIVNYNDSAPWPTSPDGSLPSLELISTGLDNSQASNWQGSYVPFGTPGASNSGPVLIYYSRATGNHSSPIWATTPTGIPGPATFDENTSFVIQSGHTVTLNNSGTNLLNLTVEAGGTLLANTNNTNPTYFDIFGNLVCDGTIGGTTNGMGFDFEGATQVVSGSGTMTVTRLRKDDSDNNTTTVYFNKDIALNYGGTCIYNNQTGTTFNVIVGNGYTIDVDGSNGANGDVSIDDTDGISPSIEKGGSIKVFGTLNISGTLYARSDNASLPCSMQVGGGGKITVKDAIVNIDGTSFTTFWVQPAGTVEVNGELQVTGGNFNAGNGVVINNNASVLHGVGTPNGGGSVTGNVTVKRNGSSGSVYNFWSAPVLNPGSGILGSTVFKYNPAWGTADPSDDQPSDPGWYYATSGSMQRGVGYAASGSGNVSFVGPLNEGNISVPVYSYPLPNVSFNLVGNPYPSAISAASFLTANSGVIQGVVYLWDDDNSGGSGWASNDYATYNGVGGVQGGGGNTPTGNIASGQGFKVNALGNGNITFTNAMRNANNNQFFSQADNGKVWLSVVNDLNHFNQTLIGFMEDATEEEDWFYDAEKIRSFNFLSLYSYLDGKPLAIQGLPELTGDRVVPLGMASGTEGNVAFRLDSTHSLEGVNIILEDRFFNTFHNLTEGDYTFYSAETEYTDRFFLHFGHSVVTDVEEAEANDIGIFTYGNQLYINTGDNEFQLDLLNGLGQVVMGRKVTTSSGITSIQLPNLVSGTYIARVQAGSVIKSERIFIGN